MSELGVAIAIVSGLAAALCLVAAWRWAERPAGGAPGGELEALLPGGFLIFGNDGSEDASPGLVAGFAGARSLEALVGLLGAEDAQRLARAATALRAQGEPFALTLPTADAARVLHFDGQRGAGADYLWVRDATTIVDRATARLPRLVALLGERNALARLIDALPLPLWRRDASGRLTFVNRAYARAVERTPEAAVAEGRELAPTAAGAATLADAVLASGEPQRALRHVIVAGERRRLELNEAVADDGLIGWALDATEAGEAKAELARHAAAHADVLENLAVAISIYGADTRLRFANRTYARLWGHSDEWLAGAPTRAEELDLLRARRRLPEAVDPKRATEQELALFTTLDKPEVTQIHLPDGTALNRRVAPHPLGGLLMVYENVTDVLALERRYNTLIAVQRRTLDHLYEGVALVGPDGRLLVKNPAFLRLWRLEAAALEDQPHIAAVIESFRPLYPPGEDWPAAKERIIARITGGEPLQEVLSRADGSVVASVIEPLPDGSVFLSYADITDREQVERALRERTQALEAADRLKSEFIASVSRELRDPLTAIDGFAQMLRLDLFGKLNARQRDYVDSILQAGGTLLKLIDDILDLASIQAGYMELTPARFDVHALLAEVFALTRDRARQRQLKMRFDCPPDIGSMMADERRLKQVLFNLVSNALQFTPAGGSLSLAAAREDACIRFTVSDSGVGIPAEERAQLFDRFPGSSARAVRPAGAGAGLGLPLVRRFVELHGGSVSLESEPGAGTCVVVRIPVEPSAAPSGPA